MYFYYFYPNYVLNNLSDSLYNEYYKKKIAKDLWESLDRKYLTENTSAKKYVVGHFLEYQMLNFKPVTSQMGEIQNILIEIMMKGLFLMRLPTSCYY